MYLLMEQLLARRFARPPRQASGRPRERGFTLMELMITVAIVGILAAVAYPSYLAYIVRSNRAAAQGYMLELTSLEQRYLLDARQYVLADPLPASFSTPPSTVSSNYDFKTEARAGVTPSFLLTATPKGSQGARDTTCGALTIDETGQKVALGGGATCW